MISPQEALRLIRRCALRPELQKVSLSDSFGLVLAKDVSAPFPMPIADNSAMDGYVIRVRDAAEACVSRPAILKIVGTIKAGDSKKTLVRFGTACRIMTGAFIPRGGEAVIPKEEVVTQGNTLYVRKPVRLRQHIRTQGEEIRKGACLLKKGTVLTPAAVGVLASFGFASVGVYKKPRVAVLATGNELLAPGQRLGTGKIYDSNSWMIRAALVHMGLNPTSVLTLKDDLSKVQSAIRRALLNSDYLILLGGVSVGDYDVVKEALHLEKVKTIFWRVNQKPGKPLFVGQKKKTVVFGLPGNPAAAFTCFYEYVYPALRQTLGYARPQLRSQKVRVEGLVPADRKRHLFLKAKILNGDVSGLSEACLQKHQGSHMLTSLVEADGFLRVPVMVNDKQVSDVFQLDRLPYPSQE